jgi:hypothetical protein
VRSWASVRPPPEERARRARGHGSGAFLGQEDEGERLGYLGGRETNGTGEMNWGRQDASRTVKAKADGRDRAAIERALAAQKVRATSPVGSGGNGLLTLDAP